MTSNVSYFKYITDYVSDNVKLIIGVSVAGGLILAIGICTAIFIVIKRKARNATKHTLRLENLNRYNE